MRNSFVLDGGSGVPAPRQAPTRQVRELTLRFDIRILQRVSRREADSRGSDYASRMQGMVQQERVRSVDLKNGQFLER